MNSPFNLKSYVGGQLLMLTSAHYTEVGRKMPKQIWRRGEIANLSLRGRFIRAELDWVAIKRGGRYFEDSAHTTTVDISVDSFYKGDNYSLVVESKEAEDFKIVFCFAEPNHNDNIPYEKVRHLV